MTATLSGSSLVWNGKACLLCFRSLLYWMILAPPSIWTRYAINTSTNSVALAGISTYGIGFIVLEDKKQTCPQATHDFHMTYPIGLKLDLLAPAKVIEGIVFIVSMFGMRSPLRTNIFLSLVCLIAFMITGPDMWWESGMNDIFSVLGGLPLIGRRSSTTSAFVPMWFL